MKSPTWECIEKLNCKISEKFSDSIKVGDTEFFFNAISVNLNGMEINAAGVSTKKEISEWKAFGECIERIIGVQKIKNTSVVTPTYRQAISNGMAAYDSLEECIQRSKAELIERNAILKSWRGLVESPREEKLYLEFLQGFPISGYSKKIYLIAETEYQHERYFTYGAFFFPLSSNLPLIHGFGCGQDAQAAVQSAVGEAMQRYVFLKDESDFSGDVDEKLVGSPMFHQEFYLKTKNHQYLREWLENNTGRIPKLVLGKEINTDVLLNGEPLYVTRSYSDECDQLYFGNYLYSKGPYFNSRCEVHPIP